MNSNVKTAIFWLVLICVVVLLWVVVKAGGGKREEPLSMTKFINEVKANRIAEVEVEGNEVAVCSVRTPPRS